VPAFYVARFPVTVGEYLAFLDDLRRRDREAAARLVPRTRDGAAHWRWSGDGFVPGHAATWSVAEDELRRLPVFGVDALGAEAYAAWRSQATGRAYRLPTEHEWEKAGRGVDGRVYPWGDRFDASFCKMRKSRPGLARPEPPGAFPIDESPYGVRDLAGGIADWATPSTGPSVVEDGGVTQRQLVSRGGAWSDFDFDCGLDVRRPYFAVERSSRVGFRLVRGAD
jgi:serine/threonine-protein kinase